MTDKPYDIGKAAKLLAEELATLTPGTDRYLGCLEFYLLIALERGFSDAKSKVIEAVEQLLRKS